MMFSYHAILWTISFFFSSRRRHTRSDRDWSSDVCSSDLDLAWLVVVPTALLVRNPPVSPAAAGTAATAANGPDLTVAQALRTPQFAAIALTYFACCATHARSEERRVGKGCRCPWAAATSR